MTDKCPGRTLPRSIIAVLTILIVISSTVACQFRSLGNAGYVAGSFAANENAQAELIDQFTVVSNVSVGDSPVMGDPKAPVIIVEFADFECPYCLRLYPVLKEVASRYEGKIAFAFRHYPLVSHRFAIPAALALEAAGKQGRFWEMHDLVYEYIGKDGSKALETDRLLTYAQELNLDIADFRNDLDSERFLSKINKDYDDAKRYGVTGVPVVFINGKMIVGVRSLKTYTEIVDEELRKTTGQADSAEAGEDW